RPGPSMTNPTRHRTEARRLLFLTHRIPYPPDKGDRIRSYRLLGELAGYGSVDLVTFSDEEVSDEVRSALGRLCRSVSVVRLPKYRRWLHAAISVLKGKSATEGLFHSKAFQQTVNRLLAETSYDAAVGFSSSVLPFLLDRGVDRQLVADLVDVDSQKWFDYAARSRGLLAWLFRLEGKRVRRMECAARVALTVVIVTDAEARLNLQFCP